MPVRLADLTLRKQLAKQRGGSSLPELTAHILNSRIERHRGAEERLEGHRPGDVRHPPEAVRGDECEYGNRRMRLRSVDEREPFLRAQLDWREAGAAQHLDCRTLAATLK